MIVIERCFGCLIIVQHKVANCVVMDGWMKLCFSNEFFEHNDLGRMDASGESGLDGNPDV